MSARANLVNFAQYQTPDALKDAIFAQIGEVSAMIPKMSPNELLVSIYVQPEKTAGGIIRPNSNVNEDRYQGKAVLLIAKGATAFKYQGAFPWEGPAPDVGEWLVMRVADGFDLDLNGVPCRMLDYAQYKMVISDPRLVY